MTTDENILEEMLERSTNPEKDDVDNMAVQMFCMVVNSNKDSLITKAHELIVKKIHSLNVTEANRAIGVLEECMSKGGEEFQKKTAKYSFLNELIALVLDRHSGTPAPVETKKRIMECLMLWTVEHSDKTKIHAAYESLKKQVNFDHGPSAVNANGTPSLSNGAREQRSSILGKDDQLVAKLLKQGGEENYKKANLVIQHRFNQEAKRTEFICHLKSELKKVESTMELLDEMLNSYSTDTPGADTQELMHDLYNTCKGHSEQMARWPDFVGDSEPELLEDVLTTKDLLLVVVQRYKELFENGGSGNPVAETEPKASIQVSQNSKTTTISITTPTASTTDILAELLGDALNPSSSSPKSDNPKNIKANDHTTLDELSEIFGSIETNKTDQTNYPSDLLGNFDLLEPISVFESETKTTTTTEKTERNGDDESQKPQGFKELREIDKLSEEMFKQNLQTEQRQTTFKKEPEKITLNDLAKDKIQTSLKTSSNDTDKKPLECTTETEEALPKDGNGLELHDNAEARNNVLEMANIVAGDKRTDNVKEQETMAMGATDNKTTLPLKPLAEIAIELDELTPVKEGQRMLLDDEDMQVSLNFTADRPSAHVSVIVMTVTNKSRLPVKDFQFEASVKKPCKVRLLAPTDTSMAPRKPFRPSEPINQVLLLMNPTEKSVDITCIVGYKLGDDPDSIKESIVAKNIPYV